MPRVVTSELLGRTVRSLAGSTTAAQAVAGVAAVLVDGLVDWCLVDLLEPPDLVTRTVALGRQGPLDLPAELGPVGARRSSAEALGLLARLADAPGRLLRLDRAQIEALVRSDDPKLRGQGQLAQRLGGEEVALAALRHGDALLGVVVGGRAADRFTEADLALLSDVAVVTGLALDAVRLLEVQRSVSTALQRSLLPRLPLVPGLALAARFVPAGSGLAVGGDWYDAFPLPGNDTALVVGDATGHDVRAATRMAELRSLLRALAADTPDTPAATLARLDAVLARLAPELSGTCLYARLDPRGGSLRWSSAGHLPPVLLRAGRAVLLETSPDLMLGVSAATRRADHDRDLRPGDVLVLYTDGLVEDRRTGLDERLRALRERVAALGGEDPERLADGLVEQLPSGEDDVAVLVVRVSPRGSSG